MFEYKIENNEVTIIEVKDKSLTVIDIPEFIDGYPVTKLSHYFVRFCDLLTNINIPNSVNKIPFFTLSNCNSLIYINSIKLKEGVNIVNNKFIVRGKHSYKIIYQIGDDYHCDGSCDYYIINESRYYINFK